MNYLDKFEIKKFLKNLEENGFAKLPSLNKLPNFNDLKNNAINELGFKTFSSNSVIHKKILKLMNFDQIILPELLKILKDQIKFDEKFLNTYHIARLIKPGQKSESYRGHFDSHFFTLVLPIIIPERYDILERGQLICFPFFRSHPNNEFLNITQKIFSKNIIIKNL